MDPPIEESIMQIGDERWSLGSTVICEAVGPGGEAAKNALAKWEDEAGITYCVWASSTIQVAQTYSTENQKSSDHLKLWHKAGTSAAVWKLRGAFVKVKAWRNGMQLESNTINFVKDCVTVPMPTVIHSWIDHERNRSYLILKAEEGTTLDQAWAKMSPNRRTQVAGEVAGYCKVLSSLTSEKLETANGCGVLEPFLTARPDDNEPSWIPQLLGPFTIKQLSAYLGGKDLVGQRSSFLFYHADLSPKNIMVGDNGDILAILDWESAGYYPEFWIGTKPMKASGFFLSNVDVDRTAWARSFTAALEEEGFAADDKMFKSWKSGIGK